jgi:hypothetical protein
VFASSDFKKKQKIRAGGAFKFHVTVKELDADGNPIAGRQTDSGGKNTRKNFATPGVERVLVPGLY